MGIPTAVLPYVNTAMAAHPAYGRSLDQLREMGVLIGSYERHRPKAGGGADRFRRLEALELLEGDIAGPPVASASASRAVAGPRMSRPWRRFS